MKINVGCLTFFTSILLTACGGSATLKHSPDGMNSSSNSSMPSSEKAFSVEYDKNNCLTVSNEDSVTNYDFLGAAYRVYSWNCVSGIRFNPSYKKLDLFLQYDSGLGCYKRVSDDLHFVRGALFDDTKPADCVTSAKPILRPAISVDIITFAVAIENQLDSGIIKYSLKPIYSIKNVGTLSLSQYRIEVKVRNVNSQEFFSIESFGETNIIRSGEIVSGSFDDVSSPLFELGSSWDVSLTLKNYYGDDIATKINQITID